MTDFKERHKEAHINLTRVANPKITELGLLKTCRTVASKLNISDQTVINYISGKSKDGYLTEAITNEFQIL